MRKNHVHRRCMLRLECIYIRKLLLDASRCGGRRVKEVWLRFRRKSNGWYGGHTVYKLKFAYGTGSRKRTQYVRFSRSYMSMGYEDIILIEHLANDGCNVYMNIEYAHLFVISFGQWNIGWNRQFDYFPSLVFGERYFVYILFSKIVIIILYIFESGIEKC